MIPDNVTLVVKAPNQQIEDQNVECESSWSIKQLKGHLSEVYPSKPRTEEQKIIYSGQLLDDSIVLKDILRTFESQIAHTIHLVCTPTLARKPEPVVQPASTPEGLRHRNVERTEPPRPEMRQNDQNHTVEMQNYLSTYMNNYGRVPPYPNMGDGYLPMQNDPAQMANHMMMMQQAYLQYMQQYANMWQANAAPGAPAPAAEPPARRVEPDEEEARDWLDHVYSASRLAILVSLVYLYGSSARVVLVMLLALLAYLHHIGFFRDLHVMQQNQGQANQRNQAGANPAAGHQPAANRAGEPTPDNNPGDDQQARPQPNEANANQAVQNQSLLSVSWMLIVSFFASLVPEANQ